MQGYLTKVGESGIKLSGGQRQRLAIARSIVGDPAILILDEATSSIDVRGEKIVQQALERVSRDRTTVVIAHRLSTIRKADNIIVMRDGRNIEEGTHEHLLSIPDGLYAGLVYAQQLEREHDASEMMTEAEVGDVDDEETGQKRGTERATGENTKNVVAPRPYQNRGFFGSVGQLLYEQRRHWRLYTVIVLAAMGAGCKNSPFGLTCSHSLTSLLLTSGVLLAKLDLCETDPSLSSHGESVGQPRKLLGTHVFRPRLVHWLVLLLAHVLLHPLVHGK